MHFKPVALSLAVLLAWHAPASANDDFNRMFARYDTNNDGRISREEARASAAADFQQLDRNRDGVLDAREVGQWIVAELAGGEPLSQEAMQTLLRTTMSEWDANGDGRVTAQEYEAATLRALFAADVDRDGAISREELRRFHAGELTPQPAR